MRVSFVEDGPSEIRPWRWIFSGIAGGLALFETYRWFPDWEIALLMAGSLCYALVLIGVYELYLRRKADRSVLHSGEWTQADDELMAQHIKEAKEKLSSSQTNL